MNHRLLRSKASLLERCTSLRFNRSVLIYLFLLHSLALLSFRYITSLSIALCVGLYLLTGFGVTVGYHRFLAHQSFSTSPSLRRIFATIGALAGQGGPLFWVSTHRLHHLMSDQDGDPHNARRGFLWSHIAWTILSKHSFQTDYKIVKDLKDDYFLLWLDNWHLVLQLLLSALVFTVTFVVSDLYSAIAAFIWAVPLRIVVVLHCTWLTNSVAHHWGYRRFATSDQSYNNFLVALLTLGEGWHNNHHAFPGSARHGSAWYELDASWLLIQFLCALKLISDVNTSFPRSSQAQQLLRR